MIPTKTDIRILQGRCSTLNINNLNSPSCDELDDQRKNSKEWSFYQRSCPHYLTMREQMKIRSCSKDRRWTVACVCALYIMRMLAIEAMETRDRLESEWWSCLRPSSQQVLGVRCAVMICPTRTHELIPWSGFSGRKNLRGRRWHRVQSHFASHVRCRYFGGAWDIEMNTHKQKVQLRMSGFHASDVSASKWHQDILVHGPKRTLFQFGPRGVLCFLHSDWDDHPRQCLQAAVGVERPSSPKSVHKALGRCHLQLWKGNNDKSRVHVKPLGKGHWKMISQCCRQIASHISIER